MHSTMKQIVIKNGYAQTSFARFMELWTFPEYAWTRSEGIWFILQNARKSYYGQKFGSMILNIMMQITIWNGHTQPMFAISGLVRPKVLSFYEPLVMTCLKHMSDTGMLIPLLAMVWYAMVLMLL